MSRVLVAMLATLMLVSLRRALPVIIGMSWLPLTPGAVIVAYAALTWPPIEAVVAAALCGLVVDALSGMPLGVSSFALVVSLLATRLTLRFFTRSRGLAASAFAGAFGVLQALVATALLAAFGDRHGGFDVLNAVVIGVMDFALALIVFPALHAALVSLNLEERGASLRERLALR